MLEGAKLTCTALGGWKSSFSKHPRIVLRPTAWITPSTRSGACTCISSCAQKTRNFLSILIRSYSQNTSINAEVRSNKKIYFLRHQSKVSFRDLGQSWGDMLSCVSMRIQNCHKER